MDEKFNELQRRLAEDEAVESVCLRPRELWPPGAEAAMAAISTASLGAIAASNELLPFISDIPVPPAPADLSAIEKLLARYPVPPGSFFQDCDERAQPEEPRDGFRPAGPARAAATPARPQGPQGSSACNVDDYIVERVRAEILEGRVDVAWEDIVGLEDVKKTIREIVLWPMMRPDVFTGLRGPPKGLLLFGPPGTGKTMIGKCIAAQCKATFFSISASSLTSKWVGEGEKMVRALFFLAREMSPSVIFIDEIDSLLSQRSDSENEGSRRIKTEFLVQFDGAAVQDGDRILVVGATNRPHEIDEAARRRLVKRIYVPLPGHSQRLQMAKGLIAAYRNEITDTDLSEIAAMADGYSGSDMFNLCREATLEPLREIADINTFQASDTRPISIGDFRRAMRQIRRSVSAEDLEGYVRWNASYGSMPM